MNTVKAKPVGSMTKAELLAHIAGLDARILVGAKLVRDLRTELAMVNQPALVYTQAAPAAHKAYYDYVRAQRTACKAAGQRVVSYQTFAQWSAH